MHRLITDDNYLCNEYHFAEQHVHMKLTGKESTMSFQNKNRGINCENVFFKTSVDPSQTVDVVTAAIIKEESESVSHSVTPDSL